MTYTETSILDQLLAVRCLLGEPDALDSLVTRFHQPLWAYIRAMSGSDDSARDTLQDAWLRIFRAIPNLRDPHRLRPFLFSIARRALTDRLRARYRTPPTETADPAQLTPTDDDAHFRSEEIEHLRVNLARLPPPDREALTLFYLHDLSLADLAHVLNIPLGTAKSRLHRARNLLRNLLLNED